MRSGTPIRDQAPTIIGVGAVVYAGSVVGAATVVGHHTLLAVVRDRRHGNPARTQPHHRARDPDRRPGPVLAGKPHHYLLHAGRPGVPRRRVRTVNDRDTISRDPGREPELIPPSFGHGPRVGSGATILAGVAIGDHALVGPGSVVTRDIPAGTVADGVPARIRSRAQQTAS